MIDIEDLTLNSLHTTLVFQAEDKVVACPPLSPGMTEVILVQSRQSQEMFPCDCRDCPKLTILCEPRGPFSTGTILSYALI